MFSAFAPRSPAYAPLLPRRAYGRTRTRTDSQARMRGNWLHGVVTGRVARSDSYRAVKEFEMQTSAEADVRIFGGRLGAWGPRHGSRNLTAFPEIGTGRNRSEPTGRGSGLTRLLSPPCVTGPGRCRRTGHAGASGNREGQLAVALPGWWRVRRRSALRLPRRPTPTGTGVAQEPKPRPQPGRQEPEPDGQA